MATIPVNPKGEAVLGMSLRLLFLMTHYSKPLDYTEDKLQVAMKVYLKWLAVANCGDQHSIAPVELHEALCDNLNTPKAIALMHGYCKRKEGDKLFASMAFLGLIPNARQEGLLDIELKTEPLPEKLPPSDAHTIAPRKMMEDAA
jgi:cysteinyl-tRNA synthetase